MTLDDLIRKLNHTEKCMSDIRDAISRRGISISASTPLSYYAALILLIMGDAMYGVTAAETVDTRLIKSFDIDETASVSYDFPFVFNGEDTVTIEPAIETVNENVSINYLLEDNTDEG